MSLIQGSYNQSDLRLGERSGVQCACAALFLLWFSEIKNVSRWVSNDLDSILNSRDVVYKSILRGPSPTLSFVRHLSIDALPLEVRLPRGLFQKNILKIRQEN